MKTLIYIASAAALALSASAVAKPGNGHGNPHSGNADYGYGNRNSGNSGYGDNSGYGTGNCPPGLAKKHNGCLPPGQAKKRYDVGQRLPYGYNSYTPYNQIPYDLRNQYGLDPYGRYIYRDGYLYEVNPRTRIISQILSAILR